MGISRLNLLDFDLIQMYELVEKPLISVLYEIEKNGIKADRSILSELSEEFGQKIKKIEQNIYSLAGVNLILQAQNNLARYFSRVLVSAEEKNKKRHMGDRDRYPRRSLGDRAHNC